MARYCPNQLTETYRLAKQEGLKYRVPKVAADIRADRVVPAEYTDVESLPKPADSYLYITVHTEIGGRQGQEDRFVVCPELLAGQPDSAFCGVFDGTVEDCAFLGDFASDKVKDLIVPHLINSPAWSRIQHLLGPKAVSDATIHAVPVESRVGASETTTRESVNATPDFNESHASDKTSLQLCGPACANVNEEIPTLLWRAAEWAYLNADSELLELCRDESKHYSSCTAVTLILLGGYACVGHLGDSRIAIGYERDGFFYAEFLTVDHKPNLTHEEARIVNAGGSVQYLHKHFHKPFIRGGDFTARRVKGEQPMQLQYSRAFGGKDLKMYGLSREPDLKVFKINKTHHVLILASDGIWDVQSAGQAVEVVLLAEKEGSNPAEALVRATLEEQNLKRQNSDNLTAIVVFLRHSKLPRENTRIYSAESSPSEPFKLHPEANEAQTTTAVTPNDDEANSVDSSSVSITEDIKTTSILK